MIRRLLLATVFAALPIGAFAQSAGGVATSPATTYNGGSLVTAGDATVGPVHSVSRSGGDVAGPVVQSLATDAVKGQVGNALLGSGSGIAPVDALTSRLGTAVNHLADKLTTAGSDIQATGLAGAPVVGSTVGQVGQSVDATVNPLASITVVDRQVAGSPNGAQLLNASVLSSTLATNAPIVASVLSGGQLASVQGVNIPGGVTGGSGGPLGGVLGGVTGGSGNPLGGVLGGLTGGSGSGSGSGASGLVGGVVSTVSGLTGGLTGGTTGTGTGGLLAPVTSLVGGLTGGSTTGNGLVGGVVGTVTNTVGGLTGGATGGGAGGLVGGVLNTVTGLTGGLTGGLAGNSGG